MSNNTNNIHVLPIQGSEIQNPPLPQTQAELEQRMAGITEGVVLTLNQVIVPFMTTLIEQANNEPLKKAAISSGLRLGISECGSALGAYKKPTTNKDHNS